MKKKFKIIYPTFDLNKIYLNSEQKSWIKVVKFNDLCKNDDFELLWSLKPDEKSKILLFGREQICPRYTKNYLKPYYFSGIANQVENNLPEFVERLLNFSKNLNSHLNQVLVNWYEHDGSIGKHSDNVSQLEENSDIFSYTFGPAKRDFRLESKSNDGNDFIVKLEDNTLVIMGGECQLTHKHSVLKVVCDDQKENNRRINITFRCFKN